MNTMCLICPNCSKVFRTIDPRKKFCDKVCRNRFNVRKSWNKLKNVKRDKVKVEDLRDLIKGIESKKVTEKVLVKMPEADFNTKYGIA